MNANRWLPPRPVARRPRRTQRPWLKGGFSAKLQVGARRQDSPNLPFRGPWLASANASLAGWAWPAREPGQCPDNLAASRETIDDQIPLRGRSAHQAWIEHLGGPYIDQGFSPVRCLWLDPKWARWAYPPCAGDVRKRVQTRRSQSRRIFWADGLAAPRP
jgi:hypothetical protein